MKGGRRNLTDEERLKPENRKCIGAEDFATLDEITDPKYAIRLLENGKYWCFDIRSLQTWFQSGKRVNPWTNVTFSQANIDKINKKIRKIDDYALMKYNYEQWAKVKQEFEVLFYLLESNPFLAKNMVVKAYNVEEDGRVFTEYNLTFIFREKKYVLDEFTGNASSPDDPRFNIYNKKKVGLLVTYLMNR